MPQCSESRVYYESIFNPGGLNYDLRESCRLGDSVFDAEDIRLLAHDVCQALSSTRAHNVSIEIVSLGEGGGKKSRLKKIPREALTNFLEKLQLGL